MKFIKITMIITIYIVLFFSCSNQKMSLLKLWDIEKTVNYKNFANEDKIKVEKILHGFSLEESKNKSNWDSGYSQQCYILRKLYFSEIIDLKDFLDSCIEVYKRYMANNKTISFHTAGYAVCLYYGDYEKESKNLFSEILEKSSISNFSNQDEYNIVIAVCNKFLEKKNIDNLEIYTVLHKMTDEEIMSIFCGN